jgi:1,4-alpha-glucan branching enzyme
MAGLSRPDDMDTPSCISLALNAHIPYGAGENCFFEALSENFLPLLAVFDRLEGDHIPFRMGISLSPVLCHLLSDEVLQQRYVSYIDKQIEFGERELERTAGKDNLHLLAKTYYDKAVDRRIAFTERYERNILNAFDHYHVKGKIELLTSSATHAFLPLLAPYPEAVQAQMEVAIASYRHYFGKYPQGFWLPELGWTPELEEYLRAYNFSYTIVNTHGMVFGKPPARRGSFYPAITPKGLFTLARDSTAARDLSRMLRDTAYRDNNRDAGYELSAGELGLFLIPGGSRIVTGYKYYRSAGPGEQVYDPAAASLKAVEHARMFLEAQSARFQEAAKYMDEVPISLCAWDADTFGRFWHEGPQFLEALFRLSVGYRDIQFMNPSEYLYKQNAGSFETMVPEFSSWGTNGYGEMWLDASNDWMYRHMVQALDRMTELAERFPDDTGLKERALNQAARELLLVQASDWPKLLYKQEYPEFARAQIEDSLRNFTTIYETLGSNYISTEWLTKLEKRHNIFPAINYRVFRRKK